MLVHMKVLKRICISLIWVHTVCMYAEISPWCKHLHATYDYSRFNCIFTLHAKGYVNDTLFVFALNTPNCLLSSYCVAS